MRYLTSVYLDPDCRRQRISQGPGLDVPGAVGIPLPGPGRPGPGPHHREHPAGAVHRLAEAPGPLYQPLGPPLYLQVTSDYLVACFIKVKKFS